jgi:hypothetical protein
MTQQVVLSLLEYSPAWLSKAALFLIVVVSGLTVTGALYLFGPPAPARVRRHWLGGFAKRAAAAKAARPVGGLELAAVRRLLTRTGVVCTTTTTHFGAGKADQYRVASACYLDVAALYGLDFADDFFAAYRDVLSPKGEPVDDAMRSLGAELVVLSEQLTWAQLSRENPNLGRYVEDRLAGFIDTGPAGGYERPNAK